VLILSRVLLSFSSRNKMIFIQSVKKYNINFLQKNMMFCILLFLSDRCLGCYFDRTRQLLSFKLLDRKRSIISVASIIYISPILQCLNGALDLTKTTHFDILSVLDEMDMTNQIIIKEQLKMSGPGVDFVSCTFILFFKK
jgi:hypothetical protein